MADQGHYVIVTGGGHLHRLGAQGLNHFRDRPEILGSDVVGGEHPSSAAEKPPLAPSGPDTSRPAMGWPPTNRERPEAAFTTGCLIPATSVTSASVRKSERSEIVALGGEARITSSAPTIASSKLDACFDIAPMEAAFPRWSGLVSHPHTSHPATESPIPIEVPISPVPTTATDLI